MLILTASAETTSLPPRQASQKILLMTEHSYNLHACHAADIYSC